MHFSIFSGLWNGLKSIVSSIGSFFSNAIMSGLNWILEKFLELVYHLFYLIDIFLCRILAAIYDVFKVFVGMDKASYKGEEDYLLNIIIGQNTLSRVFWGMAALGIALTMIFTIWAVAKKTFDLGDPNKNPLGDILRTGGTSILLIFSLTFIFEVGIEFSGVLLQQIDLIFNTANSNETVTDIVFDDEDYATMARIFDTIGNYSLSESASNSYNINSCYNDIRYDLQLLDKKDSFFDLTYTVNDTDGNQVETWQYVIAQIGRAHDLTSDQPLDESDDALNYAIVYAMDYLNNRSDNNIILTEYHETATELTAANPELAEVVFMDGTTHAARNSYFNESAGIYDALRKPYLTGEKSIYSYTTVKQDFYLDFGSFDHLLIIASACYLIYIFVHIVMDAIVRMYNLLFLYIVSPFFVSTRPVDGGKRFNNWKDAFIVELFGIFGTIIAIRLFMLLVPIIMSSDMELNENAFVNAVAKLLFVCASALACQQLNQLLKIMLSTDGMGHTISATDRDMVKAGSQVTDTAHQLTKTVVKGITNGITEGTSDNGSKQENKNKK